LERRREGEVTLFEHLLLVAHPALRRIGVLDVGDRAAKVVRVALPGDRDELLLDVAEGVIGEDVAQRGDQPGMVERHRTVPRRRQGQRQHVGERAHSRTSRCGVLGDSRNVMRSHDCVLTCSSGGT
jgi:hypothetical protein